jgi:tetratricopeptide (TPR) repeat protein
LLLRQGRLPEARQVWEQLVEVSPGGSEEQARGLHTLAHLGDALREPALADSARERCLAILEPLWGSGSLPLGELLENMADSLAAGGRPGPAAILYERAGKILSASYAGTHPRMHGLLQRWLACLMEERRWEQALEVGRRLEQDLRRAYGARHPERGRALNELGMIEFLQGRHAAAARWFEQALEETLAEPGDQRLPWRYNLATACLGAGQLKRAALLYQSVLEGSAPDSELRERVRQNLAELARRQEAE